MDWVVVASLGLAVACGAFVQSSIGFGMAVVAAPFVLWFDPRLMPGALMVTSASLPVLQLLASARDIAWPTLAWGLFGRLVVTPLGVWVVAHYSRTMISVIVALIILATVATQFLRLRLPQNRATAFGAGAAAGFSGTAASIGGPPMAILLAGQDPVRVRSTMAVFFLVGTGLSIAGLGVAGEFTLPMLLAGLAWLPFVAVGYALAAPVRQRLDRDRLRVGVLAFCVVASLALIVRAVLTWA